MGFMGLSRAGHNRDARFDSRTPWRQMSSQGLRGPFKNSILDLNGVGGCTYRGQCRYRRGREGRRIRLVEVKESNEVKNQRVYKKL